jgi:antitoxin (DNA-binding transcriptional repressor) of toxin-antitoxin stability system
MIRFFKFRHDLLDPQPARETYHSRQRGRGWPEECPPIRAANAFGFDILANFEVTFTQSRGRWRAEPDVLIESDFNWSANADSEGGPLTQQYAWFWQKGQKLPHAISDNVYPHICNQVKVSSYLYLQTDPNELILFTDVPNMGRSWRVMSGLVDTDWYPASYPWHCVLELPRGEKKVKIARGEPIARIIPVRRDTYFAAPMTQQEFGRFFERGQKWLATHGQLKEEGVVDIQRTYVRQQARSRFIIMT